jgi:hypothetical protein
LYLASTAMGLQNGMVSAYSGALIRTTHVTGLFTELGIYPGHTLRGLPVDRLRLRVCLLVAATFMLGSAGGALLFERMHNLAVLVPAMLTGACGLCYSCTANIRRPRQVRQARHPCGRTLPLRPRYQWYARTGLRCRPGASSLMPQPSRAWCGRMNQP